MSEMKLLVCDAPTDSGSKIHPCRRAQLALTEHGHAHAVEVFDKNKPLGFGSKGKRPELKEISGQEKLPVLVLVDGSAIAGSGKIVKWAKQDQAA